MKLFPAILFAALTLTIVSPKPAEAACARMADRDSIGRRCGKRSAEYRGATTGYETRGRHSEYQVESPSPINTGTPTACKWHDHEVAIAKQYETTGVARPSDRNQRGVLSRANFAPIQLGDIEIRNIQRNPSQPNFLLFDVVKNGKTSGTYIADGTAVLNGLGVYMGLSAAEEAAIVDIMRGF